MITATKMLLSVALLGFALLVVACSNDSGEPNQSGPDEFSSEGQLSDPRIDEVANRIFDAIQANDAEFAAELELAAIGQLDNVGDSIGASSEQIYGRYARKASDESLIAWLDNMLDDIRLVRDKFPESCNGYMDGNPFVLAKLYDELFTVEDKVQEMQIVEAIVMSAFNAPHPVEDFDAIEGVFNEILDEADRWATDNNVPDDCSFRIKLFESARDLDPAITADLMRLNFTY